MGAEIDKRIELLRQFKKYEDTKRSYPYNNLASNLIGYCGADNTGLFGLEERWNDVLTGTAGKVVTATDVNGKAITDEDVSYVPSENGSNIYLTIDANIQQIAERYLQQAVTENGCTKGGNVIVMNPQSGDILAMATYPNYNLNNPTSPENLGISEEEWQTMAAEDKSWRVRNELANIYPDFVDYFGNQLNDDSVRNLNNLIKDSENEVKASALKALNQVITKISSDKIQSQIIPALRGLSNESSKETKSKIGGIFGPISKIIGYNAFNTSLGVMMDSLMMLISVMLLF